jgi:hypothetical protein
VIYPEENDVLLLLCEDARLEVGNKVTLIGWYVGGDILLPSPNNLQVMLQSLALVFYVRSGDGEFQSSIKIINPAESGIAETPPSQFIIKKGAFAAQLLRIVPFSAMIGKYVVEFRLNERVYRTEFAVMSQN